MPATINADNGVVSGSAGVKTTADTSGVLALQSNGTTGLTLNTSLALGVGSGNSTGSSGQVLTSAGSSAAPTWTTPTVTAPAGSTGQVQINNAGAFGAVSSGTSGQVLTSQGSGAAPVFATLSVISVTGPAAGSTIFVSSPTAFTITDFDSYTTYNLSTTNGTVTRSGETITYTPSTAGSGSFVINGRTIGPFTVANVPAGQQAYTTPGTYSWVAPTGVTNVSVVAIGGGAPGGGALYGYSPEGGGGGGLGYINNYTVTPGSSYAVVVGVGGTQGPSPTPGGTSHFVSTSVVRGGGAAGANGGSFTGTGGGNGGNGGAGGSSPNSGGGSGAGGYSGSGGQGGNGSGGGAPGSGGGGGGGGGRASVDFGAAGGGGVDIFGEGASGAGGASGTAGSGGGGGSGGSTGSEGNFSGNGSGGGYYGGGGGGSRRSNGVGGNGFGGAVRIIWGGTTITRAFPSTNTGDL